MATGSICPPVEIKTNFAGNLQLCSTKVCGFAGAGESLSDQEKYLLKRDQGMEKDSVVRQKRVPGTEFVGKRSEGRLQNYNIPLNMRDWEMDIMGKRHLGMELLVQQTPGRKSFWGNTADRKNVRKLAPRTEFVDKRSLGMEFIEKEPIGCKWLRKELQEWSLWGNGLIKDICMIEYDCYIISV